MIFPTLFRKGLLGFSNLGWREPTAGGFIPVSRGRICASKLCLFSHRRPNLIGDLRSVTVTKWSHNNTRTSTLTRYRSCCSIRDRWATSLRRSTAAIPELRYVPISSVLNAAAPRLLTSNVKPHDSTASGAAMATRPGANLVRAVCSGIPLCARHCTGVSGWQAAADIRGCCSSPSALCRLFVDARTTNPSINSRWPRVFCGCSVEQSATTDHGSLLATVTFRREAKSQLFHQSFGWDIWCCPCWLIVNLSLRDVQHYML